VVVLRSLVATTSRPREARPRKNAAASSTEPIAVWSYTSGVKRTCTWIALALVSASVGCHDRPAHDAAARQYTGRGRIEDIARNTVLIHHERLAEILGFDGKIRPMDSMTMPFVPDDRVKITGLATGDVIQFTFEVHYEADPTLRLTAFKKLPATTTLELQ